MTEAFTILIAVGIRGVSGWLRLRATGNEGRKTIDLIAFDGLYRRLLLRAVVAIAEVLLTRRLLLLVARERLLLAQLELWLRLWLMPRSKAGFGAEV